MDFRLAHGRGEPPRPHAESFGRYFDDTTVATGIAEALGLDFEPGREIDYEHREEDEAD